MGLQSVLEHDVAGARRLREYLSIVEDLSRQTDPGELIENYRKRAQFVVPHQHVISLSRRNVAPGTVRITRSTRWETQIDPWRDVDRHPVIDRGILLALAEAARPVKMEPVEIEPDDPAAWYFEGMRSLAAAPIYYQGEPLYMVVLLRAEEPAFTLDELNLLVLTSNLVGNASSQLLLARELREAYSALDRQFALIGEIQRDLLPRRLPEDSRLRIATHYETSARAGGDYFDFRKLHDGSLLCLIADVSGHGPAAAVVMAMMHTLLNAPRQIDADPRSTPVALLTELNQYLCENLQSGQFVTAFALVIDPQRRALVYASAGHNPPRLVRGDEGGTVVPLHDGGGMPLGIAEWATFESATATLAPGDRLLLYTDGITETFSPDGEMFDVDRLDDVLRNCSRGADGMISCVTRTLSAFSNGAPPADDRTLVAFAIQ